MRAETLTIHLNGLKINGPFVGPTPPEVTSMVSALGGGQPWYWISAFRSDVDMRENLNATIRLKAALLQLNPQFLGPVMGISQRWGREVTYLVSGTEKSEIILLARRFKQTSLLSDQGLIWCDGRPIEPLLYLGLRPFACAKAAYDLELTDLPLREGEDGASVVGEAPSYVAIIAKLAGAGLRADSAAGTEYPDAA